MKSIKRWLGVLLLVGSLGLFLSPDIYALWFKTSNQQIVSEFQSQHHDTPKVPEKEVESEVSAEQSAPIVDERYEQAVQYNQRIFAENQAGINDAWTFDGTDFDFDLEDNLFGYIEIPAMEVSLPLYLGATNETMAKGAVVLGETSLPIGGINTNSVIAGHRGYRGAPYFREIERLSIGDTVLVTNLWEKLTYQVVELAVIQPDDSDAVKIQPNRDMVTLVTCHPYRSHGKYRYLVYCERVAPHDEEDMPAESTSSGHEEQQEYSGTVEFQTSEPDIEEEHNIRIIGAVVILILLTLILFSIFIPTHKSNQN